MYLPFDFGSPWVWGSVMSISRKLAGGEYASSNVCFLAWILAVAGWLFVLIFPDFQCNSYNALSDDVTLFAISSPISATTKKLIICRNFINFVICEINWRKCAGSKKFQYFFIHENYQISCYYSGILSVAENEFGLYTLTKPVTFYTVHMRAR